MWEERGTVLCWSPGGVRDQAYSNRLHLLTTSLLQGTPFLRFICRPPPPPRSYLQTSLSLALASESHGVDVLQGGEE